TNGDFIATALQRVTEDGPQALDTVFNESGLKDLLKKYEHFNVGMRRRNLSNVLRARFLNGEIIKILGQEHNIRNVADDIWGVEDNDKSLGKPAEKAGLNNTERTRATLKRTFFAPPKKTAEQREAERAEKAKAREAEKQKKADERAAA